MKKKLKYLATASIFVIGTFVLNNNIANATLKQRILNFFGIVRNLGRGSYSAADGLKVDPDKKKNLETLIMAGYTTGRDSYNFDTSKVKGGIKNNKYYYQGKDNSGNMVTLESKHKPKVSDIYRKVVTIKYKTTDGKEGSTSTLGVPIWTPGVHINADLKKKLAARKSENKNISSPIPSSNSEQKDTNPEVYITKF